MNRKNTYVCDNEYKNIYIYKKYICGGKIVAFSNLYSN